MIAHHQENKPVARLFYQNVLPKGRLDCAAAIQLIRVVKSIISLKNYAKIANIKILLAEQLHYCLKLLGIDWRGLHTATHHQIVSNALNPQYPIHTLQSRGRDVWVNNFKTRIKVCWAHGSMP